MLGTTKGERYKYSAETDKENSYKTGIENVINHSGSKTAIPNPPRTPLAKMDSNILSSDAKAASNTAKTPTKTAKSSTKKTCLSSTKKSADADHNNNNVGTPIRALNESLFEIVVESPRDVKIRELTRMVKAFKKDARYIRDVYSEEIESLRYELSQLKQSNNNNHSILNENENAGEYSAVTNSVKGNDAHKCQSFGVCNANSIISEAESIIAMAEAMLQAHRPQQSAQAPIALAKSDVAVMQSRETELLRLREEVFNLKNQRARDQERMQEMEIVMRGMAFKLEEYSRTQSQSAGVTEDNWTSKVLSFFT